MEYVALLRGINVGGKNKVVMSELREQVAGVGYTNVRTYINSGNLLFEAEAPREDVAQRVEDLLACRYDFPIRVALLTAQDYRLVARRGRPPRRALFYTRLGSRPRARADRGHGSGGRGRLFR